MIFSSDISDELLQQLFSSDDKCLEFLSELKWRDGFTCRFCGHTNSCVGKTPHSRRCTKCKKEESATNGTIFHNCKFPISKAFYIAYTVCKSNEELSSYEFARRLSLRQMTCWNFKSKIEAALHNFSGVSDSEKLEIGKFLLAE